MKQRTVDWLTARASEPSTYRGIAAGLMALGLTIDPEKINAILTLGLMVISVINVVKKDAKSGD